MLWTPLISHVSLQVGCRRIWVPWDCDRTLRTRTGLYLCVLSGALLLTKVLAGQYVSAQCRYCLTPNDVWNSDSTLMRLWHLHAMTLFRLVGLIMMVADCMQISDMYLSERWINWLWIVIYEWEQWNNLNPTLLVVQWTVVDWSEVPGSSVDDNRRRGI